MSDPRQAGENRIPNVATEKPGGFSTKDIMKRLSSLNKHNKLDTLGKNAAAIGLIRTEIEIGKLESQANQINASELMQKAGNLVAVASKASANFPAHTADVEDIMKKTKDLMPAFDKLMSQIVNLKEKLRSGTTQIITLIEQGDTKKALEEISKLDDEKRTSATATQTLITNAKRLNDKIDTTFKTISNIPVAAKGPGQAPTERLE